MMVSPIPSISALCCGTCTPRREYASAPCPPSEVDRLDRSSEKKHRFIDHWGGGAAFLSLLFRQFEPWFPGPSNALSGRTTPPEMGGLCPGHRMSENPAVKNGEVVAACKDLPSHKPVFGEPKPKSKPRDQNNVVPIERPSRRTSRSCISNNLSASSQRSADRAPRHPVSLRTNRAIKHARLRPTTQNHRSLTSACTLESAAGDSRWGPAGPGPAA